MFERQVESHLGERKQATQPHSRTEPRRTARHGTAQYRAAPQSTAAQRCMVRHGREYKARCRAHGARRATQRTAHSTEKKLWGSRLVPRLLATSCECGVSSSSLSTARHGMHQRRAQTSSGPRSAKDDSTAAPSKHRCEANRSGSASAQGLAS